MASQSEQLFSSDPEAFKWFYEQNLAVAQAFWDWRHKILTLGTGATAALIAATGALRGRGDHLAAAAPSFVGAFIAVALLLMDTRNSKILASAQKLGCEMEAVFTMKLDSKHGPFFTLNNRPRLASYTRVIRGLSVTLGIVAVVSGTLTLTQG